MHASHLGEAIVNVQTLVPQLREAIVSVQKHVPQLEEAIVNVRMHALRWRKLSELSEYMPHKRRNVISSRILGYHELYLFLE